MVAVNLTEILFTLITANHILDYNKVVDGLGHISVRNPNNNATFFMTGNPPPALVSIVHSHDLEVIPFGISDVPFKLTYHIAGFVGEEVPVFDIADYYLPNDTQNMLVSNTRFGDALADLFSTPTNNNTKNNIEPDYTLVL
ncbi:MAG: hypothetical protein Q9175_001350 [Cornicularia normoerica]